VWIGFGTRSSTALTSTGPSIPFALLHKQLDVTPMVTSLTFIRSFGSLATKEGFAAW
jgi:hypothetical protein